MTALETSLQQAIETIYRLDESLSVADFRIDGTALEGVLGEGASSAHRETLVVHEQGEEIDLALYIADEVVVRAHAFVKAQAGSLGAAPSRERRPASEGGARGASSAALSESSEHAQRPEASPEPRGGVRSRRSLPDSLIQNGHEPLLHLDEFCVATEGVSHFVYLLFCSARQERPVSQIELELQAEIDKFLVLRVLFPIPGASLLSRLFDRFRLHERLSTNEQERYQVANRSGRRYARWLDGEFRRGRGARALDDARALYRKPLAEKLDHIERAA